MPINVILPNIDQYKLTVAKPQMASEITELVNQGYQREITRQPNNLRYSNFLDVQQKIERVNSVTWLVLQDPLSQDKIIGSLQLEKEESGKNKINAFVIEQEYRGQRLGPKFLAAAENYLKTQSITQVYLTVVSVATDKLPEVEKWSEVEETYATKDDGLAKFYEHQGYSFTGVALLAPMSWQRDCRKEEYCGRVYFREMCKNLI